MTSVQLGQEQLEDFLRRTRGMSRVEAEHHARTVFGGSADACKEALHLYDRMRQLESETLSATPSYDERNTDLKKAGYEILVKIGQGGGGIVYKALQKNTGQVVAIKMLARRCGPAAAGHIRQEIGRLSQLRHLNGLVHLYDAGVTGEGRPYFVMEYVDGQNLLEYCSGKGLTLAERLKLMAEVCDSVAEIHRQGLIHRDLKPQNILVTQLGEPRILDLGLAQATWADPSDAVLARMVSEAPGSFDYAAPEQSDIRYRAQTACDCYSLGRILYELLTGHLPDKRQFVAPGQAKVDPEHATKLGFRSDAELRQRFQGDLDAILRKALAVDPGLRYQEPTALASDLRAHLAHYPVSATPRTRFYLAKLFVRRNPWWVALTLLLQAALIVTALYAIVESRRARKAEQAASAQATEALAQAKAAAASGKKAVEKAEDAEEQARAFRETRGLVELLMRKLADSASNRLFMEAEQWISLYEKTKQQEQVSALTLAAIAKNTYDKARDANHPRWKEFEKEFGDLNRETRGKWRDIERHRPGLWTLLEQVNLAQAIMRLSSVPPPNLELLRTLARTNVPHLGADNDAWQELRGAICGGTPTQAKLLGLVRELKEVCK